MITPQLQTLANFRQAVRAVCRAIPDEPPKCASWEQLDEPALWRELVGGILGSRVSYEVASEAVEALNRRGLLDGREHVSRVSWYQREVEKVLGGAVPGDPPQERVWSYPYPRQRARQIRGSVEEIYGKQQTIRGILRQSSCPRAARRQLASRIPGIGPKQASMLLRNVGFADEMAVLDVHVLTYLRWSGLITQEQPRIRTLQEYETIEAVFLSHVHEMNACPRKFDIAVWIVMRVAKKERRACRW